MDKGAVSVGTLLILVALVLIAAIVGYVLITSNIMVEQKALQTHALTKESLTKSTLIKEISATDGRAGKIRDFQIVAKLIPGSAPLRLDQTAITITKFNQTVSLRYRNGSCTNNQTTGYYTIT